MVGQGEECRAQERLKGLTESCWDLEGGEGTAGCSEVGEHGACAGLLSDWAGWKWSV